MHKCLYNSLYTHRYLYNGICIHIYTHNLLRGKCQNDLLIELQDQSYLNTTAKVRMMFLKHPYDTSFFCLKSLCALSVFSGWNRLARAFKSHFMAWSLLASPHPSFTSHTKYWICSYLCTSSLNAKHTHFLPFGGTKSLQKLSYLTFVKYVFV